ncbi:hypothetical protein SCHPADRAFT_947361 [Schizopora paradoxa]|uniref:Uncharacterized protein n=1 Tax=Schizopora paradoxa TaxID=27342 RepID=A0A0H2RJ92_9AGAM|nr:hypothetical protein SCHPADRAFT_947361 [Schizopora paradoxa]
MYIPEQCEFKDLREYNIPGMIGLYKGVTPLEHKDNKIKTLKDDKPIPITFYQLFQRFKNQDTDGSIFKFHRSFVVFRGATGIGNPARWNPHSESFTWKSMAGTEVLHVDGKPILCYIMGFAVKSSICSPLVVNSGKSVKTITIHPLKHEFERMVSGFAQLHGKTTHLGCYESGVNIVTRQAELLDTTECATFPKAESNTSQKDDGELGDIVGEAYDSPVSPRKASTRVIKEPNEHIPVYDLSNRGFRPESDFHRVAEKYHEITEGEVTTKMPIIVTFYVSRYHWKDEDNIALNLQWIGQLAK